MIQKTISRKATLEYVATALKSARQKKAISQRALSEKTGIPQAQISKIENADVDPRATSLIEIARALDLELTFVSRTVIPAIEALERSATQSNRSTDSEMKAADADLNKIQTDVRKLQKQIPQSRELANLHAAARNLQHLRIDPGFANRIRQIAQQTRPLLGAMIAAHGRATDWLANPDNLRQLEHVAKALQRTRNAIAHGAIEPESESTPAYQLTDTGEDS